MSEGTLTTRDRNKSYTETPRRWKHRDPEPKVRKTETSRDRKTCYTTQESNTGDDGRDLRVTKDKRKEDVYRSRPKNGDSSSKEWILVPEVRV